MKTQVLVISANLDLVNSLSGMIKDTKCADLIVVDFPPTSSGRKEQWVVNTFRILASRVDAISEATGIPIALRKVVGILDLLDPELGHLENLNSVATEATWGAVAAMLVLAFPEIHWVFNTPHRPASQRFGRYHVLKPAVSILEILRLLDDGLIPLFDASGLRNCIRNQLASGNRSSVAPFVPIRNEEAVVVDDELAYAFFNAYVAYRFGYRCHVVFSNSMMEHVLKHPRQTDDRQLSLSIEDLYLSFPDKDPYLSLSLLSARDHTYVRLKEPDNRILVTVGHRQKKHDTTFRQNTDYLRARREAGHWNTILNKPISGIFDLWQRAGMLTRLHGTARRGLAGEFYWPPKDRQSNEENPSHSAPGRLLEIADHLIRRAKRILASASSVEDCIVGAVFALEAQEMLGNRTPTTALDALALKHELEVTAECMFYGVQYNLNVHSRFAELEQEVKSIGRWFHPRTRRISELNAETGVTSRLLLRFRATYHFDEEQNCLNRVRFLNRHTLLQRPSIGNVILFPLRWYVDTLLTSIGRFAIALVVWVLLLGILYSIALQERGLTLWHWMCYAVVAFFGIGAPNGMADPSHAEHLVTMLAVTAGFLHLGIFVSHVYSLIARR